MGIIKSHCKDPYINQSYNSIVESGKGVFQSSKVIGVMGGHNYHLGLR